MEDLVKKIKLLRVLGQKTGTCFQRCVGLDGINAVYSVAYEKRFGWPRNWPASRNTLI
jgi:4-hydroxybutyryl-CoA dehydratase/vinylacetyl-CoA-Delta-isomerase